MLFIVGALQILNFWEVANFELPPEFKICRVSLLQGSLKNSHSCDLRSFQLCFGAGHEATLCKNSEGLKQSEFINDRAQQLSRILRIRPGVQNLQLLGTFVELRALRASYCARLRPRAPELSPASRSCKVWEWRSWNRPLARTAPPFGQGGLNICTA